VAHFLVFGGNNGFRVRADVRANVRANVQLVLFFMASPRCAQWRREGIPRHRWARPTEAMFGNQDCPSNTPCRLLARRPRGRASSRVRNRTTLMRGSCLVPKQRSSETSLLVA